jgi:hypothetical protein
MADVEACLYAQHPHTYEWILRLPNIQESAFLKIESDGLQLY